MTKGEVFDSSKLLKTAVFLIKNDVRNLIIDLSNLDYIYSDAINAIIAVNRNMIQVNGRVGVLATNQKIKSTLSIAGIQNMLNIFESQDEIIATSNEIKKQSSGLIEEEEEEETLETSESEPADPKSSGQPGKEPPKKEDDVPQLELEDTGLSAISAQDELSSGDASPARKDESSSMPDPSFQAEKLENLDLDSEGAPSKDSFKLKPGDEAPPQTGAIDLEADTSEIFDGTGTSDEFDELSEEETHAFQPAEPEQNSPVSDELDLTEQASDPEEPFSGFRADEEEGNKSDTDETSITRTRLGPQDRLRSKSARSIVAKRSASQRPWSKVEEGNTGLILTDDTDEGEEFDKREITEESFKNLHEDKSSKTSSLTVGIILVIGVIGGLVYLINKSSIKFTPEKSKIETPFLSKAREAEQQKPAVSEQAEAASPPETIVDEEPETPKVIKPKPRKKVRYRPRKVPKPRVIPKAIPKSVPKPVEKPEPVITAPPTGNVMRITSTPAGATVLVNFTKKGETPIDVSFLNNTNSVILQLKGYEKFSTKIANTDSRKIFHVDLKKLEIIPKTDSPPQIKSPPPSLPTDANRVKITSAPSGATVIVNSKVLGVTPIAVSLVSAVNKITVEKNGYQIFSTSLSKNTARNSIHAKLVSIDVPESPPVVFKPVPAAAAKPKASKPSAVTSGAGPIGRIFVASRPPGAEVTVDGKPMGFRTPHWLEVPSGSHTITLSKEGMRAQKVININPGKNKSAYLILK